MPPMVQVAPNKLDWNSKPGCPESETQNVPMPAVIASGQFRAR